MTTLNQNPQNMMASSPPIVCINYTNFWNGFNHETFRTCLGLSETFDLRLSNQPQIVLESVFGPRGEGRRRWPKALQVWFTGENVPPPLRNYDYCLSFYRDLKDPRHFRWPLFLLHTAWYGYSLADLQKNPSMLKLPCERPRFCAFIASNGGVDTRNNFVKKLSKYKPIDCPGTVLNNMPAGAIGPPGDYRSKIDFLKNYKFTICFENTATSRNQGYVTEKLTNAMLAGCIPLYWGDHRVGEDFNTESFLDLNTFGGDMDLMIERVIELDQNDTLCQQMAEKPWFPQNRVPQHLRDENVQAFFTRILSSISEDVGN